MLPSFSRLESLIGLSNVEKLSKKSVLVLGCGGVGGYVIEALARSNIGTLILVDYDVVEESNINRQIIATTKNIGKKKTTLFEKRIKEINPSCKVIIIDKFINQENILDIFKYKIDFLVDACDTIQTKKEIIRNCLVKNISFLTCLGTGNRLNPEKLTITTLEKTSYDPLARILRKYVKDEHIKEKIPVLFSSEQPAKTQTRTPSSGAFVPASAGLLIASYVVRYLLSK